MVHQILFLCSAHIPNKWILHDGSKFTRFNEQVRPQAQDWFVRAESVENIWLINVGFVHILSSLTLSFFIFDYLQSIHEAYWVSGREQNYEVGYLSDINTHFDRQRMRCIGHSESISGSDNCRHDIAYSIEQR